MINASHMSQSPIAHYVLKSAIVDNTLYLLGGINQNGSFSPAIFTAPLNTLTRHTLKWSSQQNAPSCRSTLVSIQEKYLLMVGGLKKTQMFCFESANNIYMFNNHSWEVIGQIPSPRRAPAVEVTAYIVQVNTILYL